MSLRPSLFRVGVVASLFSLTWLWLFSSNYPISQSVKSSSFILMQEALFSKWMNSSDKEESFNESGVSTTSVAQWQPEQPVPSVDPVEAELIVNDTTNPIMMSRATAITKMSSQAYSEDPALAQGDANNLKRNTRCDLGSTNYLGQRGSFWVLYNYVKASRQFGCEESITYTTHADYSFLDNLVPLLERWQGPVSLSLYCPGTDYDETLTRIQYLRECSSSLIKDLVTFHLFFDQQHIPVNLTQSPWEKWENSPANCSSIPEFGDEIITFKKKNKMLYPVNVGRNVAREMAQTHYVLASDIELYPNPNLIQNFLDMIQRNNTGFGGLRNPQLFVLPIFEVEATVTALPNDKAELQAMLSTNIAIPFHKYICSNCHTIPKQKEWREAHMTEGLSVFHTGKRQKPYQSWEPIYIGTKLDPMYDERLSWEGRSDKMTQGYALCVLDYDFHILDNAFLVHRPGIKRKVVSKNNTAVAGQNRMIAATILPELRLLYGRRSGCYV